MPDKTMTTPQDIQSEAERITNMLRGGPSRYFPDIRKDEIEAVAQALMAQRHLGKIVGLEVAKPSSA